MNIKNKSLLITGGAGFVGANIIKYFLSQKYEIHCIVKSSTDLWRLSNEKEAIIFHNVSLSNKKQLKKLAEKINPSIIIHLAAYGNTNSEVDMNKIIETNIFGTMNLLLATKDIPYKAFLNTGSSSEYGFKENPMKENDYLVPNSMYSATKASATYLCQVFSHDFNKPIATIRPFSVYGPFESKGRLIPNIIIAVLKNKFISLSPGEARHDFIYIDDLIDGYIAAIKNINKISGRVVNLGTGSEYTNQEVINTLFKVSKRKVKVIVNSNSKRTWDSPHWSANIDLAKKLLHWEPKYDINTGIEKSYKWFIKNINLYE